MASTLLPLCLRSWIYSPRIDLNPFGLPSSLFLPRSVTLFRTLEISNGNYLAVILRCVSSPHIAIGCRAFGSSLAICICLCNCVNFVRQAVGCLSLSLPSLSFTDRNALSWIISLETFEGKSLVYVVHLLWYSSLVYFLLQVSLYGPLYGMFCLCICIWNDASDCCFNLWPFLHKIWLILILYDSCSGYTSKTLGDFRR